jgi:malate permease and related proteins
MLEIIRHKYFFAKEVIQMIENLAFSLNAVIPIFLIMMLGNFLKTKMLDEHTVSNINIFVFNVALPIMLFNQVANADIYYLFDIYLILYAVITTIVIVLLSWGFAVLIKVERSSISSFVQGCFRGNFVIMGVFLISSILGENDTGKSALIVTFVIPTYNVLAVTILTFYQDGEKNKTNIIKETFLNIIKNPLIIGIGVALPFSIFQISIPVMIDTAVKSIASVGTTLALLVIGAVIDFKDIKNSFKLASLVALIKLVVFPIIFVTISIWLGMDNESIVVLFVLYASPVAVSSYIMASNMGGDSKLAANIILVTTTLSVVSLVFGIFMLISYGVI